VEGFLVFSKVFVSLEKQNLNTMYISTLKETQPYLYYLAKENQTEQSDVLSLAFIWDYSDEGLEFWRQVNLGQFDKAYQLLNRTV